MREAILNTDGGSRGNPGPAGLGFTIRDPQGEDLCHGGWYVSQATNNVAEYAALIWGMKNALESQISHITIYADSELVVKQMNGEYQVKSEDLKPLFMQARSLFSQFEQASISHVYRADNKDADRLANEAMDAHAAVGNYVIAWEDQAVNLFDSVNTGSAEPKTRPLDDPCLSQEENTRKDSTLEKNERYTGPCQLSGETYEHAGGHYEMTVKDHFDAAHTLVGYDGPCRYLHGHTWDVEVTIAGEHLDSIGILYDFKSIKRDLHAVLENFDHRFINDTPPFDVINPTAENLARVVFFELEKTLPSGVFLQEVAIWESPAAKVTYRP